MTPFRRDVRFAAAAAGVIENLDVRAECSQPWRAILSAFSARRETPSSEIFAAKYGVSLADK